jgi:hypothetical protein
MSEPPPLPEARRRSTKLILIALITLFVVLVLGGFVWLVSAPTVDRTWIARSQATSDVRWFRTAISAYTSEYGQPPAGTQQNILKALQGDNPRRIVFMERSPEMNLKDGLFLDPWGIPYKAEFSQDGFPWVYSAGENKVDEWGHGDDVASWQ